MNNKLISSLLLMSSAAFADVNMRDAAYLKTMNEFSNPLLERTYNSRSLWQGTFGFGWCPNFERRLEVISPEKALLKKCDRQIAVTLKKKQNFWIYQGSQGSETYDQEGRLVSITDPKTDLSYDKKGYLIRLQTAKEILTIQYEDDSGRIRRIQSNKSGASNYRYQEGNLVSVSSETHKVSLNYDSFHNLTEVKSPLQNETITYQNEVDEIASYRSSSDNCLETFKFQKVSAYELRSTVEKQCPSSAPQLKTYSFIARRNPQGRLTVTDIKTIGGLNDKSYLP